MDKLQGRNDTPLDSLTGVPPDLLRAYRATEYVAYDGDAASGVRIGARSAALEAILARHGAASGTFVTAWNPRSQQATEEANRAAAERLAEAVAALGLTALPHRGVPDDATAWTAEEGLFVLGLGEAEAITLAERFGQNAVVRIEPGAPAQLVRTGLFPGT